MLPAFTRCFAVPLTLLLCLLSMDALAAPHGQLATGLTELFKHGDPSKVIVDAAWRLFWSLAVISLSWNMGVILLRRADFGEFFLELVRFIVFTGLFAWLLEKASTSEGFIYAIVDSFRGMDDVASGNPKHPLTLANRTLSIGLFIFYHVLEQSQNADSNDVLILAGMSLTILFALTMVAAQIALVLIMAWMLAYGGIFLLGFGGARWTSLIAINYYKHAVAVGVALLSLILLVSTCIGFIGNLARPLIDGSAIEYTTLADVLVVALIMAVLAIKLPGLLYTLVTGSPLGLLSGAASVAGTAIVTGGGAAIASATSAISQHTSVRHEHRYETAMDAFRHAVPDPQREPIHPPMEAGDCGRAARHGGTQTMQEGSVVFGGPPPVSAWRRDSVSQSVSAVQQASTPSPSAEHSRVQGHASEPAASNPQAHQRTQDQAAHAQAQNRSVVYSPSPEATPLPTATASLGEDTRGAVSRPIEQEVLRKQKLDVDAGMLAKQHPIVEEPVQTMPTWCTNVTTAPDTPPSSTGTVRLSAQATQSRSPVDTFLSPALEGLPSAPDSTVGPLPPTDLGRGERT